MSASPFQLLPPLSEGEYSALRADIAERGILVPVLLDQHGRILDGHHRHAIAAELGIECPTRVRQVADDDEAGDLAVTLNCTRRHLNREQRRELIRAEIARRPDDSDRAIARRVGCSPSTVGAVRNGVSKLDTYGEPKYGGLLVHPVLDNFPMIVGEDFDSLAASIAELGLLQPIVLAPDGVTIVDGRQRYLACIAAGVEPVYKTLGPHYGEKELIGYIASANLCRADYSKGQRAMAVAQTRALVCASRATVGGSIR